MYIKASKLNVIPLTSGGTWIDQTTLLTYAMSKDGLIDEEEAVHLNDCTEEWYEELSKEDTLKVLYCVQQYYTKQNRLV